MTVFTPGREAIIYLTKVEFMENGVFLVLEKFRVLEEKLLVGRIQMVCYGYSEEKKILNGIMIYGCSIRIHMSGPGCLDIVVRIYPVFMVSKEKNLKAM